MTHFENGKWVYDAVDGSHWEENSDVDHYYEDEEDDDEDDDYLPQIGEDEFMQDPQILDLDVEREVLKWRNALADTQQRITVRRDEVDPNKITPEFLDGLTEKLDDENYSNKIEAIKYVREELGLGLKEAKDFVEEFADNNGLKGGSYPAKGITLEGPVSQTFTGSVLIGRK